MITRNEFMRRMKDMSALGGGGMMYMGGMPDHYNLVVNANHPAIFGLVEEKDEDKRAKVAKQLADLALLSQSLLKGPALTDFIKRSIDMIEK